MNIRLPARAGSFYEASQSSCRHHARKLLDQVQLPADLPQTLYGGLVPHAGWAYSGPLAAQTLVALNRSQPLRRVVLLGAVHVMGAAHVGEVYDSGVWRTPLGEAQVDAELAAALIQAEPGLLRANPGAHELEHSLEVQVPLIQELTPDATIVPVAVPPRDLAVQIGQAIGQVLAESFPDAHVVASSDLTHHGGHFPAPGGRGETGVAWSEANDRRLLEMLENLQAEQIVPEVSQHENACGGGAIAAAVAAARQRGAQKGVVMNYTNSYRIMHQMYPAETDDTTVGYASVVFG
jgi:AmmeMemoRadiSam system protein B